MSFKKYSFFVVAAFCYQSLIAMNVDLMQDAVQASECLKEINQINTQIEDIVLKKQETKNTRAEHPHEYDQTLHDLRNQERTLMERRRVVYDRIKGNAFLHADTTVMLSPGKYLHSADVKKALTEAAHKKIGQAKEIRRERAQKQ